MRPIDADELLEHVYRDRLDSRERIANLVKSMPSVQPEREKGTWLVKYIPENMGRKEVYECPKCRYCVNPNDGGIYDFCSACGEDMRGDVEDLPDGDVIPITDEEGNKVGVILKSFVEASQINGLSFSFYVKGQDDC